MCILGSRDQYCIHPTISKSDKKSKKCKKLLEDPKGCKFKNGKERLKNHKSLNFGGDLAVWDIEELISLG